MKTFDDLKKREISLARPVMIAGEMVSKLVFREPVALDLKGVKLLDLLQMDASAHAVLVPKICVEPGISNEEFEMLSGSSLLEIMAEVVSFFAEAESPVT